MRTAATKKEIELAVHAHTDKALTRQLCLFIENMDNKPIEEYVQSLRNYLSDGYFATIDHGQQHLVILHEDNPYGVGLAIISNPEWQGLSLPQFILRMMGEA